MPVWMYMWNQKCCNLLGEFNLPLPCILLSRMDPSVPPVLEMIKIFCKRRKSVRSYKLDKFAESFGVWSGKFALVCTGSEVRVVLMRLQLSKAPVFSLEKKVAVPQSCCEAQLVNGFNGFLVLC